MNSQQPVTTWFGRMRPPFASWGVVGFASLALALVSMPLVPQTAEARVCIPGVPDAYDLRANARVSCAKARKVARRSFAKITKCISKGRCRAAGFRCKPRMAKAPHPGLDGGKMVCKRGKGRVSYGFGG